MIPQSRVQAQGIGRNRAGRALLTLSIIVAGAAQAGIPAAQDMIWADDFEGFPPLACDAGLASDSAAALDYAKALDLCRTTTVAGTGWGVIDASLTLASGTGTAATQSHALRTAFGSGNVPLAGSTMVVLASGRAAATGQTNPSFSAFEPGTDNATSSGAPTDWLNANGGSMPAAPGCPAPAGATVNDPVMFTVHVRVPGNARAFSLSANFLSADYADSVCSTTDDRAVVLLDSAFAGVPANPVDRNLATYTAAGGGRYPLDVDLAHGNTGLFTQCVNGTTGCYGLPGATTTCTGIGGLTGTGMDVASPGMCDANSLVGGATGWLSVRGNVVPGETIRLRMAIWDSGDHAVDSVILLDNFRWSSTPVTPGLASN